MESLQFGLAGFGALEFCAQIIEKERADDFQDVALVGVMPADLPSLSGLHDCLEQRAENRR
jgi:hypothetical protein